MMKISLSPGFVNQDEGGMLVCLRLFFRFDFDQSD